MRPLWFCAPGCLTHTLFLSIFPRFLHHLTAKVPSLVVSRSRFHCIASFLCRYLNLFVIFICSAATHFTCSQPGNVNTGLRSHSCVSVCEFLHLGSVSQREFLHFRNSPAQEFLKARCGKTGRLSCFQNSAVTHITNLPWPSVSGCSRFTARQIWWWSWGERRGERHTQGETWSKMEKDRSDITARR